jgi:hypothetical protein
MNSFGTSLLLAAFSVLLLGCNKTNAPTRPNGVPASAVWAGGVDGGAFIDCSPSRNGEPNPCTVYNDSVGDVDISGRFVVKGQRRGVTAEQLKYAGAPSGTRIDLQNQVTLVLLPQERPESVPKTALLGENGVYADCHSSDNNLQKCSLYLAANGANSFSGSYRCKSLPDAPCTGTIKYADRAEIVLQNAGDMKIVK